MGTEPPVTGEVENPVCPGFLDVGALWNDRPFPFFLVIALVEDDGHAVEEFLMLPTHSHMKLVVSSVSHRFKIQSVHYVTPGHMNRSGQWMVEPVMELSELANAAGHVIARCKVKGDRVYRGERLESAEDWGNDHPIYRAG